MWRRRAPGRLPVSGGEPLVAAGSEVAPKKARGRDAHDDETMTDQGKPTSEVADTRDAHIGGSCGCAPHFQTQQLTSSRLEFVSASCKIMPLAEICLVAYVKVRVLESMIEILLFRSSALRVLQSALKSQVQISSSSLFFGSRRYVRHRHRF